METRNKPDIIQVKLNPDCNYLQPDSFISLKAKISSLQKEISLLKDQMYRDFSNSEIKCGNCGSDLFINNCSLVNFYQVICIDDYDKDYLTIRDGSGIHCYNCKCYLKFAESSEETKTLIHYQNCFKNRIDIVEDTDYIGRPIWDIKQV